MKEKRVKVAILGAGTAGMSAWREVSKVSNDFVLINGGEYGTTCARVGCMPSKLFIQPANDFHRRKKFQELGILGAESLRIDSSELLKRVRKYRDRFVKGVLQSIESIGDKNIRGYAKFEEPNVLRVDSTRIIADKIILAVGSRPLVPQAWMLYQDKILTTDDFFELENLPSSCAVIGTGVVGLELGQAMSRLGVRVSAYGGSSKLAILTDPKINEYAINYFRSEFESMELGQMVEPKIAEQFEKVLMAVGRKPNFDLLDFEKSGAQLNEKAYPDFNPHSMQVKDCPHLFLAGDVNGDRPILHEAADEGRIAGFNASRDKLKKFKRRTPLGIVFTDPNLVTCGASYSDLAAQDPLIGEVSFETQGRSVVAAKATGLMRLYADRNTAQMIGAEFLGPSAEHLGHLVSWSIQQKMTAFDLLSMPYYHPVIEEGLRTAIRKITKQLKSKKFDLEVPPCDLLPHEAL